MYYFIKILILLIFTIPLTVSASIGQKDCAKIFTQLFASRGGEFQLHRIVDHISTNRNETIESSWLTTRNRGARFYREEESYALGGNDHFIEFSDDELMNSHTEQVAGDLRELATLVYGERFSGAVLEGVRDADESIPKLRASYSVLKSTRRRKMLGGMRIFNATRSFDSTDATPPFIKYLRSINIQDHPLINRFHSVQDLVGTRGIFELGKFVFEESGSRSALSYQLGVLIQAAQQIQHFNPEATVICFVLDRARMRLFKRMLGGEVWPESIGRDQGYIIATNVRTFLEKTIQRADALIQEIDRSPTILNGLSLNQLKSMLESSQSKEALINMYQSAFDVASDRDKLELLTILRNLGHLSNEIDHSVLQFALRRRGGREEYDLTMALVRAGIVRSETLIQHFGRIGRMRWQSQSKMIYLMLISPFDFVRSSIDDYLSAIPFENFRYLMNFEDFQFGPKTYLRLKNILTSAQGYQNKELAFNLLIDSYLSWDRANELLGLVLSSNDPMVRFFAFDIWDDCLFSGVESPREEMFYSLQNELIRLLRFQTEESMNDENQLLLRSYARIILDINKNLSDADLNFLRNYASQLED